MITASAYAALDYDGLRRHYIRTQDREDLGYIDEADALPGWKSFDCSDNGYTTHGTGGRCRPLLTALYASGSYTHPVTKARCDGVARGSIKATWHPRYGQRVNPIRFAPCDPPVTWGCPSQCGVFSHLYLDEDGYGLLIPAAALTRSWGNVIRGEERNTGEAWRAQFMRIEHIFITTRFATLRHKGDAKRAFERRYKCPVTVVDRGNVADGMTPREAFADAAADLGLPNITRP